MKRSLQKTKRRNKPLDGQIVENEPLADKSWFRTGGAARYFYRPTSVEDLSTFLQGFLQGPLKDIPIMTLGVGSNLIIRDGGFDGLVIRLSKAFSWVEPQEGGRIKAGAACMGITLANAARDAGIGGLEFLSGVPGTLGGAVRMNAGAYGCEMADCMIDCRVMDRSGKIRTLKRDALGYRYRSSDLGDDQIIIDLSLQGQIDDPKTISSRLEAIAQTREQSQPLRTRTGGSTFKNPSGKKAWELIDAAGCRGMTRGGAQVSEKHCNFLINTKDATSADLEGLGEDVRRRVRAVTGIDLVWEIRRIGSSLDDGDEGDA